MRQETKHSQPVICRYKYDPFFCHGFAIINRYSSAAAGKGSAIYPYKNGPFFPFHSFRPNIKVKAILTYGLFRDKKLGSVNHKRDRFGLYRAWTESITFFYSIP